MDDELDSFPYTCLDESDGSIDGNTACKRDLQQVLRTIEKAAYTAGKVALSTAGQIAVKSTKANARDLVTESDVECQRVIKEVILNEFPNDVFMGEEDVDLSSGDSSVASSDALKNALGIAEESDSEDRLLFVVVSSLLKRIAVLYLLCLFNDATWPLGQINFAFTLL